MTFPLATNTTCDIYRSGNGPPAAPDEAGVAGTLQPRARNIKTNAVYTHWFDLPLLTDVRFGASPDTLYVPDKNGTPFLVVAVERVRFGAGDYKRAYLNRQAVSWPSNQL
jgi:hypothetical protein